MYNDDRYKKILVAKVEDIFRQFEKNDPYKRVVKEKLPDDSIIPALCHTMEGLPGYTSSKVDLNTMIPELETIVTRTQKEFSIALSRFGHQDMVYLNHEQRLEAILYFPYTPHYIIHEAPIDQVLFLAKYLNLELTFSNDHIVKIAKQKLIDLYYLACDTQGVHVVTDCCEMPGSLAS